MKGLIGTLAMLATLVSPQLQAASSHTSCSAASQAGYVITRIQERSSSCNRGNLYTFTRLAGETVLETCVNNIPGGWVNSRLRSYTGSGICGSTSGTPKNIWQISNSHGQTKLNSCLQSGLPSGWVITRQTSYSGSGDCGQASGNKRIIYEVQSTAGQSQMNVCSGSVLPTGWQVGATSSSSSCGSGSGNLWKILNTAAPNAIALHRYANAKTGDRLYVTSRNDKGMAAYGYSYELIAAKVPDRAVFGTAPLHRYYNKATADSLYTISRDDAGQKKAGYDYAGTAANVYTAKVPNSTPLYRYWNPGNKHHLYLIEHFPDGVYGYRLERGEGFVYKP